MNGSVLDGIINRLLEVRTNPGKQVQLSETEIKQLCFVSRDVFLRQPMLLELEAPVKICGDIHGQYSDLLRLFEYGGLPPRSNYLFLGDYVDRGKQSLETICLLLAYKIKYPENFFLLRGNHECASINRIYGFYDECKRRFNVRLWRIFTDCFNCLPVAALIDEKILCMHGGLSPDLKNLKQIRMIQRPTDVAEHGLLCDLLWSDPSKDIQGWGPNERGVSFTFGADRVVEDGYEFFANRKLVTLFSAPNYCGEFDNAGAMMSVDESLMCSFQILKPADKKPNFWNLWQSIIVSLKKNLLSSVKKSKVADFDFVVEKVNQTLQGWSTKLLSQAGRVTLLQNVIQSITVYSVPTFLLFKKFWWVENEDKNYLLALSFWDSLYKPKSCGDCGLEEVKTLIRPSFINTGGLLLPIRTLFGAKSLLCGYLIGSVNSVEVWNAPWLLWNKWDLTRVSFNPIIPPLNVMISSLLDDNGAWNKELIIEPISLENHIQVFPYGDRLGEFTGNFVNHCLCNDATDSPLHLFVLCPLAKDKSMRLDFLFFVFSAYETLWVFFDGSLINYVGVVDVVAYYSSGVILAIKTEVFMATTSLVSKVRHGLLATSLAREMEWLNLVFVSYFVVAISSLTRARQLFLAFGVALVVHLNECPSFSKVGFSSSFVWFFGIRALFLWARGWGFVSVGLILAVGVCGAGSGFVGVDLVAYGSGWGRIYIFWVWFGCSEVLPRRGGGCRLEICFGRRGG
ncbi:hypothetical protein F8388_004181 [Cannabis sativa]|uniref:Serine/threonine-protein phosphatase n=1 Tax=Cannabis sativa TaxID=3483 RepID=A0A7J6E913_CANSA|nr:hypothetical protein F8388_004181 [Cannabis sativa]